MLAFCLNDGTAYRLVGSEEQPRLSDGTLLPNAAEWTVPGSLAVRYVPDLRDPATLGCLLALVRKAYPNRRFMEDGWRMNSALFLMHCGLDWDVRRRCFGGDEKLQDDGTWADRGPRRGCVTGKTEAEALVAALEAAS